MTGAMRITWPIVFCLAAAWPAWAAEPKEPGGQPAAGAASPDKPAAPSLQPDKTGEKPGKETTGEKPAGEKAAGQKPAEPDPYIVPEGTPKELVQFIKKVAPMRPADAKAEQRKRQAILKAAEKILAASKATDEEAELAVQAKISMLQDEKKIAAFGEELRKAGRDKLARMVRLICLLDGLRNAMSRGPEQTRIEKIKTAVDAIVKFLEEGPPRPDDVRLVEAISAQVVEPLGDSRWAAGVHRSLAKLYATSKDARLREFGKVLEGVARRLTLVGDEMKIEGTLLDGKPFDWSKYAGKVVLVDFWATWCGPCLAEIPKMRKYYDFYHDKGFDIVGISCDHRLADLEKFVKEKKIPWPIIFGGERPSPTVTYYGVRAIPAMILVGKDGKVVALNARGPYLKEGLEKLLGPMPPPKKDEAKKGDQADQPDDEEPGGP